MQEIISKINNLTLENSENQLEGLLLELRNVVIQNSDVSRSILNENFLKSLEFWMDK